PSEGPGRPRLARRTARPEGRRRPEGRPLLRDVVPGAVDGLGPLAALRALRPPRDPPALRGPHVAPARPEPLPCHGPLRAEAREAPGRAVPARERGRRAVRDG